MSLKAYYFSVWPPVGDDCPGALAGVPGTSPKAALKRLREAGLKVTSKDPITVSDDLTIFDDPVSGEILWQATGEEQWRPLRR